MSNEAPNSRVCEKKKRKKDQKTVKCYSIVNVAGYIHYNNGRGDMEELQNRWIYAYSYER